MPVRMASQLKKIGLTNAMLLQLINCKFKKSGIPVMTKNRLEKILKDDTGEIFEVEQIRRWIK